LRKTILILIIVVGTGCLWFVVRSASHKMVVLTYFQNAPGLTPGARVRVDGVEVGFVRGVTVEGARGNRPIAVHMTLDTSNGLRIPSDATTSLEAESVLGPTFVEIDTRNKTGALISNNGVLESIETPDNTGATHAFEVMGNALLKESKKLQEKEKSSADSMKPVK